VAAVALTRPATTTAGGDETRPVVFLDIVHTPAAWEAENPDSDRFTYWGYKFEAMCAAAGAGGGHAWSRAGGAGEAPEQPARHGRPEWAALLRRRLGPVDLLFAAEVDGFCPELAVSAQPSGLAPVTAPGTPPVPLASMVEVKTLRWPTSSAGAAATLHRRKVPTWWVQAWLAGCSEIWAGGREGDGTLTRVDRMPTASLPAWSASQGGRWCPAALVECGGRLLEWMAGVAASVPGQHVRFTYAPPPSRWGERGRGGGGGSGGGGGGGGRWVPPRGGQQQQQRQQPGTLTATVVEGGELGARVRAALDERRLI
jgi:hypothetical protein